MTLALFWQRKALLNAEIEGIGVKPVHSMNSTQCSEEMATTVKTVAAVCAVSRLSRGDVTGHVSAGGGAR